MKKNIFIKYIYFITNISFVFIGFYIMSCVSVTWKEDPSSDLLFLEGANLYAHVTSEDIVRTLATNQGITDPQFVSIVDALSISRFDSSVVIVMKINRASLYKKHQIMIRFNATSLEETNRYWSVQFKDTLFLVDIGYSGVFVITSNMSLEELRQIQFIKTVPKAASLLEVNNTDSFWLWSSVDFFKQFLSLVKIGNGSGALRIPEYVSNEDVKTAMALPYSGARSDLATLKLTLPFLFRSIEANILGSLPEIKFTSGIVTVNGLQLPAQTVKLFLDIVAALSIIE